MQLSLGLNETLGADLWRACDILRRDNNVGGVMQYTEHLAWLLFLKFFDQEEKKRAQEAALRGETYTPVLPPDLSWDAWASLAALQKWDSSRGQLAAFVRGRLLPGLASLNGSPLANTIARLFSDESIGDQTVVRNVPVCASDYNLKEVLTIINAIDFDRDDHFFTITRFYEDLLARMGQENQIAGEFHTPRPIIRFMVEVIDPQIGETVYDPACGSAGFLAQAHLWMEKQTRTLEDLETLQQCTFYGREKKALAALLVERGGFRAISGIGTGHRYAWLRCHLFWARAPGATTSGPNNALAPATSAGAASPAGAG
jgi:type I restriction enzyme M protein